MEIRVLVLLVFGFLLAGLALAFAQLGKSSADEDPNSVSSWDDRETAVPGRFFLH